MNLQKFGKLIKLKYGSIGGELLNKMYIFYISDRTEFEKVFDIIELNGTKGCFLYRPENERMSVIVFGTKFVLDNSIQFEGKVIAKGELSEYKIGSNFTTGHELDTIETNRLETLDSVGLIKTVSDLKMITSENEHDLNF